MRSAVAIKFAIENSTAIPRSQRVAQRARDIMQANRCASWLLDAAEIPQYAASEKFMAYYDSAIEYATSEAEIQIAPDLPPPPDPSPPPTLRIVVAAKLPNRSSEARSASGSGGVSASVNIAFSRGTVEQNFGKDGPYAFVCPIPKKKPDDEPEWPFDYDGDGDIDADDLAIYKEKIKLKRDLDPELFMWAAYPEFRYFTYPMSADNYRWVASCTVATSGGSGIFIPEYGNVFVYGYANAGEYSLVLHYALEIKKFISIWLVCLFEGLPQEIRDRIRPITFNVSDSNTAIRFDTGIEIKHIESGELLSWRNTFTLNPSEWAAIDGNRPNLQGDLTHTFNDFAVTSQSMALPKEGSFELKLMLLGLSYDTMPRDANPTGKKVRLQIVPGLTSYTPGLTRGLIEPYKSTWDAIKVISLTNVITLDAMGVEYFGLVFKLAASVTNNSDIDLCFLVTFSVSVSGGYQIHEKTWLAIKAKETRTIARGLLLTSAQHQALSTGSVNLVVTLHLAHKSYQGISDLDDVTNTQVSVYGYGATGDETPVRSNANIVITKPLMVVPRTTVAPQQYTLIPPPFPVLHLTEFYDSQGIRYQYNYTQNVWSYYPGTVYPVPSYAIYILPSTMGVSIHDPVLPTKAYDATTQYNNIDWSGLGGKFLNNTEFNSPINELIFRSNGVIDYNLGSIEDERNIAEAAMRVAIENRHIGYGNYMQSKIMAGDVIFHRIDPPVAFASFFQDQHFRLPSESKNWRNVAGLDLSALFNDVRIAP